MLTFVHHQDCPCIRFTTDNNNDNGGNESYFEQIFADFQLWLQSTMLLIKAAKRAVIFDFDGVKEADNVILGPVCFPP